VAERAQLAKMPPLIIVVYTAAVYLLFLAVLGYAVGFFAGFGVPKGIDQGSHAAALVAVAIDLLLLLLFAVQHTVMARPWFKRRWRRIVPEPAERASFVLTASLVLALVFWLWRPVREPSGTCRNRAPTRFGSMYAAGLGGDRRLHVPDQPFRPVRAAAGLAACATRQVQPPPFTERGLYRRIRHPLMAGFVVIFWSAPVMTTGRVLFAATATGYIMAGIAFEKHDLIGSLGDTYTSYQARAPACSPDHSGTSDPRAGRKAVSRGDGASPTRAAASSRASRNGRNGTFSAVALHRPARTVPPPPLAQSASSLTRRLFPIPARPRTTSIWPPVRHARWSWVSSRSRPTMTGHSMPPTFEVRASYPTASHST
jgi:methanethiol S-methyltransferase